MFYSLVFSLLVAVGAKSQGRTYHVRKVEHRSLLDPSDLYLTHSDDGKSKTLPRFLVDIYPTRGSMNEEAEAVVRMAMNEYLLTELNDIYGPESNELESVGTELLRTAIITKTSDKRSNLNRGTEMEMELTLTFDNEPSPDTLELHETVKTVMADLSSFVTNLTAFENQVTRGVTYAERREILTRSPTEAPVDNTDSVNGNENASTGPVDQSSRSSYATNVVTPVILASCIIALAVYLIFRRRKKSTAETPKGDLMYVDVENDLYSMDRSLESSQSPPGIHSPNEDSIQYSTSADGAGDSIFSGVDSTTSFTHNVRANKASTATSQAGKINKRKLLSTPKFAHSPLSMFSEESVPQDEDELSERYSPKMADQPSLTDSDISSFKDEIHGAPQTVAPSPSENSTYLQEDSIQQPSSALRKNSWYGSEPGSSGDVLADLAVLSSIRRGETLDPTPTGKAHRLTKAGLESPAKEENNVASYNPYGASPIKEQTNSVCYNPFNCNPITSAGTQPTSPTVFSAKVAQIPQGDTSVLISDKTPLRRNSALTSSAPDSHVVDEVQADGEKNGKPASTVGSMSAKASQIIGGIFGFGGEGATSGNTSRNSSLDCGSKPCSPSSCRSGRGNRTSTPTGKNWQDSKYPGRAASSPPGAENYLYDLSRPSSPGGKPEPRMKDCAPEYGCLPFRRMVDKAPGTMESNDPEGIYPGSGRRHAGNKLGGDGTAMYQTNAMEPLDWSYKSADIASVGDSTISENDGAGSPRHFISKKNSSSLASPRGESKTPMSQVSNGSPHASPSRQLVNDLLWLEKKIADVRQIDTVDSLSYVSQDNMSYDDDEDPTISTDKNDSVMSSIVCRDCYAPPGKLHIVIHSTKDGPAVHTVKEGSSLEGHIFPGDLIISVDNVDTRSYTAEQVMKMMATKSDLERKITVLHFEEEG